MKNNKEKEELQSRREFFKDAAKKALPVLGAIALAASPIIAQAAEKVPMGCNYGCAGTCSGQCTGTCMYSCYTSCDGGCKYNCDTTCKGGCRESCSGGCRGGNTY